MNLFRRIADKLADKNRRKKYDCFMKHLMPTEDTSILDVGGSEKEYRVTANILEKIYPYPENITVLGVDQYDEFLRRYSKVKIVTYDGGEFPFKNNQFDLCWCNAVIEHVGNEEQQEYFLNEIKRVSKKAFITTPNKHFPVELHTKIILLHFLPKKIFDKILTGTGKSWAAGDYMHLLSLSTIKRLLRKCNIDKFKIIKNKILGFTVDYVVIF